jgi:SAM-dependent methyltransferase
MTGSPYTNGYGLRWPSSSIVSDLFHHRTKEKTWQRAMDFGCGLGPHGRLLETCNYKEIYYIDEDIVAIEAARNLLNELPFEGTRFFHTSITEVSESLTFDVIIDRASLQHVSQNQLHDTLNKMANLLKSKSDTQVNHGVLISEWIVEADHSSQVQRFPHITFFHHVFDFIESKFETISLTYVTSERLVENEILRHQVANLVLRPKD